MLIESDADDAAEVLVVDDPMVLDSDLEDMKRRKRSMDENEAIPTASQEKLRRRKKLRKRKKPKVESEEQMTTVESVVLIEQLPLSGVPDRENPGRIKTLRAKTTKIKHLPQSPLASGKKLKRRKKTKTSSSEKLDTETIRNPEKRYYSLEQEPTKFRRNYAEVPDSGEFIPTKIRRFKGKSGTRRKEGLARAQAKKPKIEPEEKDEDEDEASNKAKTEAPKTANTSIPLLPTASVNATDAIKAGAISKAIEAAFKDDDKDKDKDKDKDDDKDKDKEKDNDKDKEEEKNEKEENHTETPTEEPLTTPPAFEETEKSSYPVLVVNSNSDGSLIPNKPPGFESVPRENNFKVQLKTFSALALCIARVLFDIWCCGQLVASVPFLFGLCFTSRCLFLIRLMLDALFLVILFIYTITIIAFTAILRIFVDEMTSDVVFEWLVFGAILAFVLLLYIVVFVIVLRCCELILNEKPKAYKEKRSKSLLYTEIGSEQLLEAADDV